ELPTCSAVGVLGALRLQVGGMLATDAVKLITGIGDPLLGRVAVIDSLRGSRREIPLVPIAASSRTETTTPEPTVPEIAQLTAEEMLAAQAAGATLLDVREPYETATGIVADSVVVPLAEFFADPAQVEGDRVVVICAHGIRAQRAAEVLRDRGVAASVLAGGLAAWAS